jgi:hypothetical protein
MVALYNVGDDVSGTESKVTTLSERADYASLANAPPSSDKVDTVEIVQARYSIAIAAAGAERFVSPAFATANEKLAAAEAACVRRRVRALPNGI